MMKAHRWILFGGLLFATLMPMGCTQSVTAPSGTTISFSKSATTWDITATSCPSAFYNDEPITITVKDANGKPMNNVDLTVKLDLSPNTASAPVQVLELYDGINLVTSPYSTKTGDFGTKTLVVRVDFGCTYKAKMSVFSGTAFGEASFETN